LHDEFHALYNGVQPYVPPGAAEMEPGDVAADGGEESGIADAYDNDIDMEDDFIDEPSMGDDQPEVRDGDEDDA
jgi:hypothetical protein